MVDRIGVGLGPRNSIREDQRQAALDAAAVLQVRRSELAAAVAAGHASGAEVVAHGLSGINTWLDEQIPGWSEILSVRDAAIVPQLRVSLINNRRLLASGGKMMSLFDYDGTEPTARWLLAGEEHDCYRLGVAPVQMKIIDQRFVLLQGPFLGGDSTVMAVTASDCLEAAWRYWQVALASSVPAREVVRGTPYPLRQLTPRQHQVIALMAADTRDESIAAALEVSVRTVRSDIARIMEVLGVRSRFAAGVRIRELVLG